MKPSSPSSTRAGGGGGKGHIVIGVIILVVFLVAVLPMLQSSELHENESNANARGSQTTLSSPNDPNAKPGAIEVFPGEFEPIVDPSLFDASENPTLAAAAACRMMDIVHRRLPNNGEFYTPSYASRAKLDGPLVNNNLYTNRIKRWRDTTGDGRSGKAITTDADGKSKPASPAGAPSIFCIAYTEGGEAAKKMVDAWMGECDDYLIVSRFAQPPPGIPIEKYYEVHVVQDTKPDSMYPRLTQTLHMLSIKRAGMFDYFVYVTDDSHVVVENLRMALNEPSVDALHRMGAPLYVGHRMVAGDDAAFISNAMMIINTYLLKMMTTILPDTRCFVTHQGGSEDLFLSKCMLAFRIFPLSIEDVFGHERLHILPPDSVAAGGGGGWYTDYHRGLTLPKGLQAFSASTFHFHTVGANDHQSLRRIIV